MAESFLASYFGPPRTLTTEELGARRQDVESSGSTSYSTGLTPPEEYALLRAAEGCLHRDPGSGCCGQGHVCELASWGPRRIRVTINECLRCQRAREPS